ncbi:MAG: hypothetical protein AAB295_05830, partial [Chloroflexota bacterium]
WAQDAAGHLAGAKAALEASTRTLEGVALQGFRAESRTQLARLLVARGDLAGARAQAELARAEVGPSDIFTIATTAWAFAVIAAADGRAEEAERSYREARERIGSTGYRTEAMQIQRDHARFLIETGRATEAWPLLEQVRAFYDTPQTGFERDRTAELLERCAAAKRQP